MKKVTEIISDEAEQILAFYSKSHSRKRGWIISYALTLYREKFHAGDNPPPFAAVNMDQSSNAAGGDQKNVQNNVSFLNGWSVANGWSFVAQTVTLPGFGAGFCVGTLLSISVVVIRQTF